MHWTRLMVKNILYREIHAINSPSWNAILVDAKELTDFYSDMIELHFFWNCFNGSQGIIRISFGMINEENFTHSSIYYGK